MRTAYHPRLLPLAASLPISTFVPRCAHLDPRLLCNSASHLDTTLLLLLLLLLSFPIPTRVERELLHREQPVEELVTRKEGRKEERLSRSNSNLFLSFYFFSLPVEKIDTIEHPSVRSSRRRHGLIGKRDWSRD